MVLFASILSLFFSFLLFTKKKKSGADYLLLFWMLFISFHLLLFHVSINDLYRKFPHLIGIDFAFPIFQALFLFFYVRMLTSGKQHFYISDVLHLAPSISAYIYMIPFFMKEGAEKYSYFQDINHNEKFFLITFNIITVLSAVIYTFLTFRMIEKYRKFIGQHFSYSERINLLWMKRLLIGMAIIWLIVISIKIIQVFINTEMLINGNSVIYISASLFVIFLGYFGIRQTTVFSEHSLPVNTKNTEDAALERERYQKSGLKEEQVEAIKERLIQLMESEKLYLDNKLSLDSLAKEINLNPNYLSQVINEYFSKNFYDFVNYYRIEDFKRKASEVKYKNYSILALALDCGFNSKSAFYNVFKKQVGITPSEFLKKSI